MADINIRIRNDEPYLDVLKLYEIVSKMIWFETTAPDEKFVRFKKEFRKQLRDARLST